MRTNAPAAMRRRCTACAQRPAVQAGWVKMAVAHSERCERPVVVSPGKLTAAQRCPSRRMRRGRGCAGGTEVEATVERRSRVLRVPVIPVGHFLPNRKAKQSSRVCDQCSTAALHKRTACSACCCWRKEAALRRRSVRIAYRWDRVLCACVSTAKACPARAAQAVRSGRGRNSHGG